MPRSGRHSLQQAGCIAAAVLSGASATADPTSDDRQLAGDYFVGASVFLFERTVLAAFVPAAVQEAGNVDALLDAGAIVLAREDANHEAGSVALQAILGWLNAWIDLSVTNPEGATPPPGFAPERLRDLACLAYGSDPTVSAELADRAGIGVDGRGACVTRYAEAYRQWDDWLEPFRKTADAPVQDELMLRLAFAPTLEDANQAIADALRENGLFQVLTDDLNATFVMPHPMTALITQCGAPKAFYNPDRGEAVLCYEMLGALLQAAP